MARKLIQSCQVSSNNATSKSTINVDVPTNDNGIGNIKNDIEIK